MDRLETIERSQTILALLFIMFPYIYYALHRLKRRDRFYPLVVPNQTFMLGKLISGDSYRLETIDLAWLF